LPELFTLNESAELTKTVHPFVVEPGALTEVEPCAVVPQIRLDQLPVVSIVGWTVEKTAIRLIAEVKKFKLLL
jgi:hypothetical protein